MSPDQHHSLFEAEQKEEYAAVSLQKFLQVSGPIIDVRAPCEYTQGHIPGSFSIPLFNDEERAQVGTVYKKKGRETAIQTGLEIVGPKLASLAKNIQRCCAEAKSSHCRITCFRGGMRSKSVQWLCQFVGLSTVRLDGGYKQFRREVLATFERPFSFVIIGGPTGSGKTQVIQELAVQGFQAIDLEALANHRGSAFGLLPGIVQPTNEHFENILASRLWQMNPALPIFLEDESRLIGSCVIPKGMYDRMDVSRLFWLQMDFAERQQRLVQEYGCLPKSWLQEKVAKLQKKLGGARVHVITKSIEEGNLLEASAMLLEYYDAAYLHSKGRRPRPTATVTRDELFDAVRQETFACGSHA